MMRKIAITMMAMGLAACASDHVAPPAPMAALPPPVATTASIDGVALYHSRYGRTLSCAGFSVALIAETPRMRERMVALYGSAEHAVEPVSVVKSRSAGLAPSDPPVDSAQCSSAGAFAFHNLQPGAYFMIARVQPTPAGTGPDDLVILQRVALRAGEAREVHLAP